MAVGMSQAFIQSLLNILRGTSRTGIATLGVGLATGDPGASGTANASANTAKNTLVLAAPAGTTATQSSLPSYTMTASENISHITLWDGSTFIWSAALSSAVPVINGSTLTISNVTAAFSPVAV